MRRSIIFLTLRNQEVLGDRDSTWRDASKGDSRVSERGAAGDRDLHCCHAGLGDTMTRVWDNALVIFSGVPRNVGAQ